MRPPRNTTLDVARGFTVFIMPAVHSLLYYGNAKTRQSYLAKVMAFLAEGPGAQLFLFLMGASLALGKRKSAVAVAQRATGLLARGFLLNLLRLVVPYKLGLLPEKLLEEAGIAPGHRRLVKLLTLGDILQCAAVSYPVAACLHHRRPDARGIMLLAACVALVSPKLGDRRLGHPAVARYFSILCTGKPPEVFFPVFPWLTYPLAGLAWAHYLETVPAGKLYPNTALAGVLLLASGTIISRGEPAYLKDSFYRLGTGGTCRHLGIVLLWLCLCHTITKRRSQQRFVRLLAILSRRITRIYTIQWMLVLWLIPVFGYRKRGLAGTAAGMLVNTLLAIHTAKLKLPYHEKYLRPGGHRHRPV